MKRILIFCSLLAVVALVGYVVWLGPLAVLGLFGAIFGAGLLAALWGMAGDLAK